MREREGGERWKAQNKERRVEIKYNEGERWMRIGKGETGVMEWREIQRDRVGKGKMKYREGD